MKTWTKQAQERLERFLDEHARREGFDGTEADELKADLRCHILEEAERDAADTIGVNTVEMLLQRLDNGNRPGLPVRKISTRRGFFLSLFAIYLPLLVTIFEMVSQFCGSNFFAPVSSAWHAALLLLVPASNAWLIHRKTPPEAGGGTGGVLSGVAMAVAAFYCLLFLPLAPISLLALIFFGIGLLSLTPLLAFAATWRVSRRAASVSPRFKVGRRWGVAAGVMALLALEGPAVWTRANLELAAEPETAASAVSRLRAFHSERALLTACYEGAWLGTDISGWIRDGWRRIFFDNRPIPTNQVEAAREVFFRVTGKPFNSVKAPERKQSGFARGRGEFFDPNQDFEVDENLGSDQVAMRLKYLDLSQSRFDGHLDSVSRTGYGEWTMVFSNASSQVKEGRCQIRLPQGGRVSRLTLWVNGEPREAAFSTVAKVKAAYKEVAVVQRRDPVLVTMCGPDSVMVQCFPIPANGEMKIRFGITAPILGGRWELPRIVEQNFGCRSGLTHAVWMQGDRAFSLNGLPDGRKASHADGPAQSLAAELPVGQGHSYAADLDQPATGPAPPVWCVDHFAKEGEQYLLRQTKEEAVAPKATPIIVVDGSASMMAARDWLLADLRAIAGETTLLLADDTARKVSLTELENHRFSGGRDNEPALREAVRLAKSRPAGTSVVWVHGPQAVKLSSPEALLQLLERGANPVVIHSVEAVAGPNRLGEALYQTGAMRRGPALIEAGKDFAAFLDTFRETRAEHWEWTRTSTKTGLPGTEVWDHLARTWAVQESEAPDEDAGYRSTLAARYQLVTPVSGAVVLETMEQYERAGLTPGDPAASPQIPVVPEPSSLLLVALATGAAVLRRKREAA